jgi:hypothetical protein
MGQSGLLIKNIAHSFVTRYKINVWRKIAMSGNFTTCKNITQRWEIKDSLQQAAGNALALAVHASATAASVLVCFRVTAQVVRLKAEGQ